MKIEFRPCGHGARCRANNHDIPPGTEVLAVTLHTSRAMVAMYCPDCLTQVLLDNKEALDIIHEILENN